MTTEKENIGYTVEEILEIVQKIGGVPVVFAPSFICGEKRIECREESKLWECAYKAWQISPTSEVLVEKLT